MATLVVASVDANDPQAPVTMIFKRANTVYTGEVIVTSSDSNEFWSNS